MRVKRVFTEVLRQLATTTTRPPLHPINISPAKPHYFQFNSLRWASYITFWQKENWFKTWVGTYLSSCTFPVEIPCSVHCICLHIDTEDKFQRANAEISWLVQLIRSFYNSFIWYILIIWYTIQGSSTLERLTCGRRSALPSPSPASPLQVFAYCLKAKYTDDNHENTFNISCRQNLQKVGMKILVFRNLLVRVKRKAWPCPGTTTLPARIGLLAPLHPHLHWPQQLPPPQVSFNRSHIHEELYFGHLSFSELQSIHPP